MGRLSDYIEQRLGTRTKSFENRLVSSIGTTAARVFPGDPDRLAWIFVNLSANAIYLVPGNDPSSTKGIYVAPNGGSVAMSADEDYELVGREFYGVAAGAGSNVYTLEVVGG